MLDPVSVVTGRAFRLTLGLRPLDPADWLQVDAERERDLAEKRRVLATRHDDVVATLPEGEEASRELLELVLAHLAEQHPELAASPQRDSCAVEAAGRLVQEDLCVLSRANGWRLVAASVCFPSRWRLADKIGHSVAAIHEPVPGYLAIAAATDAFFDRLAADRPMWRTNWTILPSPALFQGDRPDTSHGEPSGTMPAPPELTFRVERQTLRRLPRSGAIVFTIRTHRMLLAELVRRRPAAAHDLAATLRTVPPPTIEYKGWADLLAPVLDWLDGSGASGG